MHQVLRTLALLALAVLAPAGPAMAQTKAGEVRIGYQKSSTLITILKSKGTLEKVLAPRGLTVRWSEFASGLPLLEALNAGALDLSADVADTVPVVGQAEGLRLTYVAQEAPSPKAQAIVVATDSPITKVADLKGRKVAVTKAAGAHYLLIMALEHAGLTFTDIEPVYLSPAEGRAALLNGSVAAWVPWDPFLAAVQRQAKVRILTDGRYLADYQRYYLAATPFAEARPEVIKLVFGELQRAGTWVKQNPAEAAAFLAPLWGLDADTVALANSRRSYVVRLVVPGNLSEQQKIADLFFAEGLLPRRLVTNDVAIWKPGS
jgi:sulfonate transport system substrate-binding protein